MLIFSVCLYYTSLNTGQGYQAISNPNAELPLVLDSTRKTIFDPNTNKSTVLKELDISSMLSITWNLKQGNKEVLIGDGLTSYVLSYPALKRISTTRSVISYWSSGKPRHIFPQANSFVIYDSNRRNQIKIGVEPRAVSGDGKYIAYSSKSSNFQGIALTHNLKTVVNLTSLKADKDATRGFVCKVGLQGYLLNLGDSPVNQWLSLVRPNGRSYVSKDLNVYISMGMIYPVEIKSSVFIIGCRNPISPTQSRVAIRMRGSSLKEWKFPSWATSACLLRNGLTVMFLGYDISGKTIRTSYVN